MSAARLSEQAKIEILDAYKAGEKVAWIATQFGVDPSYPGLLAKRRGLACRTRCKRPPAEVRP